MAKNDMTTTDNPKLMQKRLSDGNYSLYLDYYMGRMNITDPNTGETKSKVQRTLIISTSSPCVMVILNGSWKMP